MPASSARAILILGGTGHFGRHIVWNLVGRGAPARVVSRDAEMARRILGTGSEIMAGDITAPETVRTALEGVGAVVISISAFAPRLIRRLPEIEGDAVQAVLEEAGRAGVGRVVYLSVFELRQELAVGRLHLTSAVVKGRIESALAHSSLNWTVLGAAPSMQIFFAMIRGHTMVVPGGGPPALPTVSAVDVGQIAAQAVLRDDLRGRRIRMVSPEALSFPEAARRISAALGRPIGFRAVPLILPKLAWALTRPLAPLNDRVFYIHEMLGFVRLLNEFPPAVAAEVPAAHRALLETFQYVPTTLEMEARRWAAGR